MRSVSLPDNSNEVRSAIFFFEIILDSGTVRLTTATRDITLADTTVWQAIGRLGKIGNMQEGLNLLITSMTVQMQGIPVTLFPTFAAEKYRNKLARVLIGIWDDDGLVNDPPLTLISGKVVQSTIVPGSEMQVSLRISSDLSTMKKRVSDRYSDAHQQAKFPGDLGLQFVDRLREIKLTWGR